MRLTEAYNLDPGSSTCIKGLPNQRIAHASYYSSQNSFYFDCCIVPNSFFKTYCMNFLILYVNLLFALANKRCCAVAVQDGSIVRATLALAKINIPWGSPSGSITKLALLFVGGVEEPPVPILNSSLHGRRFVTGNEVG